MNTGLPKGGNLNLLDLIFNRPPQSYKSHIGTIETGYELTVDIVNTALRLFSPRQIS